MLDVVNHCAVGAVAREGRFIACGRDIVFLVGIAVSDGAVVGGDGEYGGAEQTLWQ